jgi:magnesium-transporting ATPase (P-type)
MEFSSDRKRMSILIQDKQDGKYKLYMKGADTIVFDRLAQDGQDQKIVSSV